MSDISPRDFLLPHLGRLWGILAKSSADMTAQVAPYLESEEWYTFQRVLPPDGTAVDDEIAAGMADKFKDLVNLVLKGKYSRFKYVVSCHSEVTESIPVPDAVMNHPDPPTPNVEWGTVYALFDFSPHVQVDSSIEKKYIAWAGLVRSRSPRPRDIVLGVAFDANKFRSWVVKPDGTLLASPVVNLPRILDLVNVEASEAKLKLLNLLSTIALADCFLTEAGRPPTVENGTGGASNS